MKFKLLHYLTISFFLFSCYKHTAVKRINLKINENPPNGSSLGRINSEANQTLFYLLMSDIPQGSIHIDSYSGEIFVADSSNFDYEQNQNIQAEIQILSDSCTHGFIRVDIRLNDIIEE